MTDLAMTYQVLVGQPGVDPFDASPLLVDITARMRQAPGPSFDLVRGRAADRGGIRAGSIDFDVDNTDGYFDDPTAFRPGQVVQVRATYGGGAPEIIFRGVVDAWPKIDDAEERTIPVSGYDLFGLLAQGDAPASAWDAHVRNLPAPPDQWWRPGADGWYDQIGGATGRHTGGLEEMDPLVDGDEKPFGQEEPDGHGVIEGAEVGIDLTSATWKVISGWCRIPPQGTVGLLGVRYGDDTGDPVRFALSTADLTPADRFLGFEIHDLSYTVGIASTPVRILNDSVHHWQIHFQSGADDVTMWLDGQRLDLALVLPGIGGGDLDGPPVMTIGATPEYGTFSGTIDHLLVWNDYPNWLDELDAQALEGWRAGRQAWANERLDQRTLRIVGAWGGEAMAGTFDESGIVTQQGYRPDGALQLLQTVEDTEQGRIWIDRFGQFRFSKRSWAWTDTVSTEVQAHFVDTAHPDLDEDELPMLAEELTIVDDPRSLTNVAQVTSEHGRQQTSIDAASIALVGRRNPVALSGLLHPSDRQSKSIADWLIASRSNQDPRVEKVSFLVEDAPEQLAPLAQRIDEGWLIQVDRNGETYLGHVVGIRHSVSLAGHQVDLILDSDRVGWTWFTLDDSLLDGPDGLSF